MCRPPPCSTVCTCSLCSGTSGHQPSPGLKLFVTPWQAQQLGTYQLVAAGVPGTQCLVVEFATACNAGQDGAVCAWHNAAVRDCDVYAAAPLSQHPEDVWFSSPGPATALLWAGAPQVRTEILFGMRQQLRPSQHGVQGEEPPALVLCPGCWPRSSAACSRAAAPPHAMCNADALMHGAVGVRRACNVASSSSIMQLKDTRAPPMASSCNSDAVQVEHAPFVVHVRSGSC